MAHTVARWGLIALGLLVIGPLLAIPFGSLRLPDGAMGSPALLSTSPAWGFLLLLAAMGVACALGVIAARVGGTGLGLAVAGFTLAGPAWTTGVLDGALRARPDAMVAESLRSLAIEGALVAALAGLAAVTIGRAGRRGGEDGERPDALHSLGGLALAGVVAGVAASLVARESIKGQNFGAALVAGAAGATAARLMLGRAPAAVFVVGVCALGVVGPVWAMLAFGDGALRAAYEMRIPALARPLALDWASGGMVGVALGLYWAASLRRHPGAAAAPA